MPERRKNYEPAEANAIGTEYLRSDLLPAADADRARSLLRLYLDQRVAVYTAYTQAAWWNRIPTSAWLLMSAIAVIAHLLFGYGAQNAKAELALLTVLSLVVSISFLLTTDINSPRTGIIRVNRQNLTSPVESLRAH
jgi:hypothetical protein